MTDQSNPASRPWRRFLRFSVRGMIVVVLVIGAGMGWLVHQAHVQRDAVAAIVRNRGGVLYDWEWRDGNWIPDGKPRPPPWLVDLFGIDFFGRVTEVWLTRSAAAPDAAMEQVARLTRLQRLEVDGSSVSDAGLAHMKGLTNLSDVQLRFTQVSDAGLVHLKLLTSLESLDLSGTQVTDAGLAHLKELTKLASLFLHDTQVTDAGMKKLQQTLPRLRIYR
jgi:internalin A